MNSSATPMRETLVLVVGAGPVGLQMALDLGWRGTECIIIDKGEGTPVLNPRASGLSARTMEFLRRWDLAETVRREGFPSDFDMSIFYCTALNGYLIGKEGYPPLAEQPAVPFSPENNYRCPQTIFDPLLARALRQYPCVDLMHRIELESFEQDPDGVTSRVRDLRTGEHFSIRSAYMIACDGRGSRIGAALGIEVEGRTLSYSVSAILRIPKLFELQNIGPGVRYLFVGPEGTWANLTAIDGREQWRFTLVGSEEKLNLATLDVDAEIRRAIGPGIHYELLHVAPWRRNEMVAQQFRHGRVFLAGDAAHTMSPHGGHGMNTGVGDAVDLGWKISATLAGWGGDRLLDTYEIERRPVALRNVRCSTHIFKEWVSVNNPQAITADTDEGCRTRERICGSMKEALRSEWETWGVQLGYTYDGSPICVPDGTSPVPDEPEVYIQTARPGSRAPHAWLPDGRSIIDLFGRTFLLLRLAASGKDVSGIVRAALNRKLPLEIVDLTDPETRSLYGAPLVLVRPDGHVAWRADEVPSDPGQLLDIVRGAFSPQEDGAASERKIPRQVAEC